MKYKTFRGLLIGGGLALAGGLGYTLLSGGDKEPPPPSVAEVSPKPAPPPAPAPQPVKAPEPPAADGLRPMDREVLARVKQGISGDKVKDVFPGKAYKVSLY